jgi:N-acetylmuramoyl-L-alanine amidase
MAELNLTEKYLAPNPYSRCGYRMDEVRGIVYHYPAKALQTAAEMWRYFENLKNQTPNDAGRVLRKASVHFIVDLDGSVLQLMPLEEIAYHAGPMAETRPIIRDHFGAWPNLVMWGIEMCHVDQEGRYTPATLKTGRELGAYLCELNNLNPDEDIFRHHDITGKLCPKWFVDHPADWVEFKLSIKQCMLAAACAGVEGGN